MAPSTSLSCLFALLNLISTANAQTTCYWPSGDPITNSADATPCTAENSGDHLDTSTNLNTCCPSQWRCLPNGLCQNPSAVDEQTHSSDGLFGRYGCTDPNWQNCAAACLDTGPVGAEAVLQCSTGQYCCDRNRVVGNCCNGEIDNDPSFFGLSNNGQVIMAGDESGSVSSEAPESTSSVASPSPSSAPAPTTSSSPPSTTPPAQTSTPPDTFTPQGFSTTVSTSVDGGVRTVVVTTTPTSTTPTSGGGSSSNLGLIVGCAVGIPLGLALIGVVIFFVWRRRKRAPLRAESPPLGVSEGPYTDEPTGGPNQQILGAAGFGKRPTGGPYEADGTPVDYYKQDAKYASELHSNSASPGKSPVSQSGTPVPPYDTRFSRNQGSGPYELPTPSNQ